MFILRSDKKNSDEKMTEEQYCRKDKTTSNLHSGVRLRWGGLARSTVELLGSFGVRLRHGGFVAMAHVGETRPVLEL